MKDWDDFDKFTEVIHKYMPDVGEGTTIASQTVTAVNKLIYKWYNDGDVFDNTGRLIGWANDLSSYANWIYKNFPEVREKMTNITKCSESDYEDLLYYLAEDLLKEDRLAGFNNINASGSIYDCDGPFKFKEA